MTDATADGGHARRAARCWLHLERFGRRGDPAELDTAIAVRRAPAGGVGTAAVGGPTGARAAAQWHLRRAEHRRDRRSGGGGRRGSPAAGLGHAARRGAGDVAGPVGADRAHRCRRRGRAGRDRTAAARRGRGRAPRHRRGRAPGSACCSKVSGRGARRDRAARRASSRTRRPADSRPATGAGHARKRCAARILAIMGDGAGGSWPAGDMTTAMTGSTRPRPAKTSSRRATCWGPRSTRPAPAWRRCGAMAHGTRPPPRHRASRSDDGRVVGRAARPRPAHRPQPGPAGDEPVRAGRH